jgi:quercetin 2,3-dioxygenase
LKHRDTTGTEAIIKTGDIQIMSAGSGLQHSEMNNSRTAEVKFLQIWVFPKERNINPRYDQKTFNESERINNWQIIVSPEKSEDSIWINQDAWFSLTRLEKGKSLRYLLNKKGNGIYVFILKGDALVAGESLQSRDGLGISETEELDFSTDTEAEILVMEVPMSI